MSGKNRYAPAAFLGVFHAILMSATPGHSSDARGDWSMFGRDQSHTRCSTLTGPSINTKLWDYPTGHWVYSTPTIAADGTIYVGSHDKKLHAINPDGTNKWEFQAGYYIIGSPAIATDGTVYFGCMDHKVYAVNPDGTKKWDFEAANTFVQSPTIGPDGRVYIGSTDAKLYCLEPDGTKAWDFAAGTSVTEAIVSSAAIATDGTVYVGSRTDRLYAINADGTKKWEFVAGADVESSPAIAPDGTIYVGSSDGYLHAINPDGTEKWAYDVVNGSGSSPAVGPDGTIYVGSNSNWFYAINPDGSLRWSYQTRREVGWKTAGSPAVDGEGNIYFVGGTNIFSLAPDGTDRWVYALAIGDYPSSPSIGNDGTIYFGTNHNKVYAIGPGLGDTTGPRVTINQASTQPDPASTSPVVFTVIFSEPAADFDSGDVSLSGTAGATTATVTGSGTNYEVAVSGMTGDGTVVASIAAGVAQDATGHLSTASTSWDNVVTYWIAPRNVSIAPSGGTIGIDPITLDSLYRDPNGFANIHLAYLLLSDSPSQSNSALARYVRSTNRVYLKNDANTSWGIGYVPGANVTLENSQCYLYVKDTTVSGSGDELTVNWRIALKSAFAAKRLNAYMYVQDMGGLTDGWDRMGAYYDAKPEVVNIDPNDEVLPIDTKTTLTSLYRDINGFTDIRKCYMLVCESFGQANALFVFYDRLTNKVYLKNDTNTSWGTGYTPGTDVTLSNSQCEVYVRDIVVSGSVGDLTITWSFKLKAGMTDKNLYSWMYVADSKGLFDGWKKVGTHFTPLAPTVDSVAPNTGKVTTGVPQVFTTQYSDPNGYDDIYQCYFQIGQTGSLANTVCVLYDQKQNRLFLRNDAHTSWGTGYAPGTDATLENTQCTLRVKDTTVSSSGLDSLIIDWSIVLKPTLIGKLLGERMYCRDNEWMNSGWRLRGYVRGN